MLHQYLNAPRLPWVWSGTHPLKAAHGALLAAGSTEAPSGGGPSLDRIARDLATYYRQADSAYAERETVATHRLCLPPPNGSWPPAVEAFALQAERLRPYARAAAIHGSFGSGDPTARYSDLYVVVVVSRETLADPTRLDGLRREMTTLQSLAYAVDPLQHHGIFTIAEPDLSWYPQTFLPADVWRHARSLLCSVDIVLRERRSDEEAKRALSDMAAYWRDAASRPGPLRDPYGLKLQLSILMLLPAVYLQACGRPCYKRESFDLVRPEAPPGLLAVLDEASEARARWDFVRDVPPRMLHLLRYQPDRIGQIGRLLNPRTPARIRDCLRPRFGARAYELAAHLAAKGASA